MDVLASQGWSSQSPSENVRSEEQAISTSTPKAPASTEATKKRQRSNEIRLSYPRKRAVAACQLCRSRKVKCDNQRPSCTSCRNLKVECTYRDSATDHSNFDQASLTILDRLNYAIQLVENLPQNLTSSFSNKDQRVLQSVEYECENPTPNDHNSNTHNRNEDGQSIQNSSLMEALEVAANCASKEILQWPIFEGIVDPEAVDAAFFEPQTVSNCEANRTADDPRVLAPRSRSYQGVRKEDVLHLAEKFLTNVHIKNPVLDPKELRSIAKNTSEDGFNWEASSCLILIVCALAKLSVPYAYIKVDVSANSSYLETEDYQTAEMYYTASRKRVGLLEPSVIAAQCVFLIGIYEMYSLRPLKAWLSFNHAATIFQTYLQTRTRQKSERTLKRLEQRLYWSILKSEVEMRDEIDLPPNGLGKVDYPDIFPSPPGATPGRDENDDHDVDSEEFALDSGLQQSWFYYLSEIAYRRISNRIMHALFRENPLMIPFRKLKRIAEELEAQAFQWWEHVPNSLSQHEQILNSELAYVIRSRYTDLLVMVYRPFLYILIHGSPNPRDLPTITH